MASVVSQPRNHYSMFHQDLKGVRDTKMVKKSGLDHEFRRLEPPWLVLSFTTTTTTTTNTNTNTTTTTITTTATTTATTTVTTAAAATTTTTTTTTTATNIFYSFFIHIHIRNLRRLNYIKMLVKTVAKRFCMQFSWKCGQNTPIYY